MPHKEPFYLKLWVVWLILTLLYCLSLLTGTDAGALFAHWIGIFVPVGYVTLLAVGWTTDIILIPSLVIMFIGADVLARRLHLTSIVARSVYNLVWLLAATYICDLLFWHVWQSWCILQGTSCIL